jgi:peptidyl-prolyl cis-trans isomerase A (cyclophilin A)
MASRVDSPQQSWITRRITQSMRDQALGRRWLRRVAGLAGAVAASTLVASGSVGAQAAGVRVVFETTQGKITLAVDTVHAPITGRNFLRYVDGHFYDGGHFFRTVREDNQATDPVHIAVVQVGADPARLHDQFPPIPLERTTTTGLHHLNGTVSMARNVPNSATSSFFICIGDQPALDFGGARNADGQGFAAFGRVVEGMDVVRAIWRAHANGQALTPPVAIISARREP